MLSQFFVKCETLASWGGRTIWLVQDELVGYIEESTDFRRTNFRDTNFRDTEGAGTFVIYTMQDSEFGYQLRYVETICGPTRPIKRGSEAFMTDMVGAGYVPPLTALEDMLLIRRRPKAATNWRDIEW